MDSNCSHYLVTKGKLNFYTKINNKVEKIIMSEGDSIWVASIQNMDLQVLVL